MPPRKKNAPTPQPALKMTEETEPAGTRIELGKGLFLEFDGGMNWLLKRTGVRGEDAKNPGETFETLLGYFPDPVTAAQELANYYAADVGKQTPTSLRDAFVELQVAFAQALRKVKSARAK